MLTVQINTVSAVAIISDIPIGGVDMIVIFVICNKITCTYHKDIAVLKSTNGLLCPGDILSYRLRNPWGKPKLSTIASLLDPSTPDKKLITHENGVILKPFVHDVKQQKMYGEGACGHLINPLLVWMKMEQCTLFVGCTSDFIVANKDDNHIVTTDGDVTDDSNTTNCVDLDSKHSMNIIYGSCIKCVVHKINIISKTILNRQLKHVHEQTWSEGTYQ